MIDLGFDCLLRMLAFGLILVKNTGPLEDRKKKRKSAPIGLFCPQKITQLVPATADPNSNPVNNPDQCPHQHKARCPCRHWRSLSRYSRT